MPTKEDQQMNQSFQQLVDEFLRGWLDFHPSSASSLGFHEYDGKVENLTRESILNEIARLKSSLQKFQAIDPRKLSKSSEADYNLITNEIKSELLEFEEIRNWERNPMFYAGPLDVTRYVKRNYAPLEERLKSLIQHEKQFGSVLTAAKANLHKEVPKTFVETAVNMCDGIASFLEKDLPKALKDVKSDGLMKAFQETNQQAIAQVREFSGYLKKELLPKANDRFALGEENYKKMLLYSEMISTPLDSLLKVGLEELKKTQEQFRETAAKINPNKSAIEIFKEIQKEHPAAESLIPDGAKTLEELRQFILQRHIVSLPPEVNCKVEETPPFLRSTSFASMDSPGPFETKATEAFYYITPVEKDWSPEKQEEWLTAFNYYTLKDISIHEAYPGHYTDFLHLKTVPSKIAKIFGSYGRVEGWAHYTEQMMLEEGYGNNDPKLRLGQLDEALLRLCRFIVSIKLHTQEMGVDEAKKFFVENAYYEELPAKNEAYRGTFDPGYLNYTLGKLQILGLRDEYKKKMGEKFTLQEFHDKFLSYGLAPIPVIRKMMLEN